MLEYLRRILSRFPWWDVIVALSLIAAGIKFTSGYEDYHSISLYDETIYLERGVNIPIDGLPRPQWSPLYSLWYYFLSIFTADNMDLFFLQVKLSYILPAIFLFLALRALKVSPIPAVALAVYFLISSGNTMPWPRINSFAMVLVIGLLIITSLCKGITSFTSSAALGLLVISFVRPEFFVSYLILAGGYFFILYLKRKEITRQKEAKRLSLFMVISAALLIIFGSPIGASDNYRTRWAFQQHFSLNWVSWTNNKTLNPWTDCEEISKNNFGEIESIQQAAFNNPSIFLKHMATNLHNYPRTFFNGLSHTAINNLGAAYVYLETMTFTLLLVVYLFSLIFHHQHAPMDSRVKRAICLLIICALPSFISVIVIYPRPHYVTVHIVMAIILLSLILFREKPHPWKRKISGALLTAALVLVVTPSPYAGPAAQVLKKSPQPVRKTVRFIRKLGIHEQVKLLVSQGAINVYIGSNYSRVSPQEKESTFFQFLSGKKINMILYTKSLVNNPRFRSDPQWKTFQTDPKRFGFYVIDSKGKMPGYLLVHRSLIS